MFPGLGSDVKTLKIGGQIKNSDKNNKKVKDYSYRERLEKLVNYFTRKKNEGWSN